MLKIENLTIRFGGLVAVNNVSFEVGSHEIVGLVGPNGAGKTTVFNAVSGIVKSSEGNVIFQGQSLKGQPLHKIARLGIGRTFQIPQPMHELTVRENLIVAQRFGAGKVDEVHLNKVLEFMNLKDKEHAQAATDLALTELKALEVAKALMTKPKMLLLDEVLAGLEVKGKQYFMNLIHSLHKELNIGILIIEHDIETIMKICSRACVLDFGQVIANDTPEVVFQNPDVIRSYTGGDDYD